MSRISPKQIAALGFQPHGNGLDRWFSCETAGWSVRHCGHPTALWPWYGIDPEGAMILHTSGYAFQYLGDALKATREAIQRRATA